MFTRVKYNQFGNNLGSFDFWEFRLSGWTHFIFILGGKDFQLLTENFNVITFL